MRLSTANRSRVSIRVNKNLGQGIGGVVDHVNNNFLASNSITVQTVVAASMLLTLRACVFLCVNICLSVCLSICLLLFALLYRRINVFIDNKPNVHWYITRSCAVCSLQLCVVNIPVNITSDQPPLILPPHLLAPPFPPKKTNRSCTNLVSRSSRSLAGGTDPGPPGQRRSWIRTRSGIPYAEWTCSLANFLRVKPFSVMPD